MQEDFAAHAKAGASPRELAGLFLDVYYEGETPALPVNPFKILKDMGIIFSFRNFKTYEGVYIPAEDEDDVPIVGINGDRQITRQRYTAAHELCHHIKDARREYICDINKMTQLERYAESFAAELLMPHAMLVEQVAAYQVDGYVSFQDALKIADCFGVSFAACINQLAYELGVIKGDISSSELARRRNEFKPAFRRREQGMNDLVLYRQLFDIGEDYLKVDVSPRSRQLFETEYVFHDSRMEGIAIEHEDAAEIVVDLRLKRQGSRYCDGSNKGAIEVAGLALAYEWVFDAAAAPERDFSLNDIRTINNILFSAAPYPEHGGSPRQANTLVIGGGFETVDYLKIEEEMFLLGEDLNRLVEIYDGLSVGEYIEQLQDIHHRLTVIHPFRDGNGRSIRAFINLLLLRRGLPPVLFTDKTKKEYKDSLTEADKTGSTTDLAELYYKQMLMSHAVLTDNLF